MKILPHRDSISPILVSKGIVTEALEYSTISDKQNKNFDKDDILDILLSDNALVKETINLRQEMIRIDHAEFQNPVLYIKTNLFVSKTCYF